MGKEKEAEKRKSVAEEKAEKEEPAEEDAPLTKTKSERQRRHEEEEDKKAEPKTQFAAKYPKAAALLEDHNFELCIFILIAYCGVHLGLYTDCYGSTWANKCSKFTYMILDVGEHLMLAAFVFEWSLRVLVNGKEWFNDTLNLIDTFAIWGAGVFVSWVFRPAGVNIKFFYNIVTIQMLMNCRLFRAARIMRMTHMMHDFPALKQMWFLLVGVQASMLALLPSLGMLLFSIFIGATAFVIMVGRSEEWSDEAILRYTNVTGEVDPDVAHWPLKFRTLTPAMFTLSRFLNSDNAAEVMETIMIRQKWIFAPFMAFTGVTSYVLVNLVTAVITNTAMEITKADHDVQAREALKRRQQEQEQLEELFIALDDDGSGEVSTQEFNEAFEEPAVRDKLLALGYEEDELKELFRVLDSDGTGLVDAAEFCQGMAKLKGLANSRDLLTAMKSVERIEKHLRKTLRMLYPGCEDDKQIFSVAGKLPSALQGGSQKKKCDCKANRKTDMGEMRAIEKQVSALEGKLHSVKQSLVNLRKLRREMRAEKETRQSLPPQKSENRERKEESTQRLAPQRSEGGREKRGERMDPMSQERSAARGRSQQTRSLSPQKEGNAVSRSPRPSSADPNSPRQKSRKSRR